MLQKRKKVKRKTPNGLYKNCHNWPTYMLHHSGIEPSTLRRSACVFRRQRFNKGTSHTHSSLPLPSLLLFGQSYTLHEEQRISSHQLIRYTKNQIKRNKHLLLTSEDYRFPNERGIVVLFLANSRFFLF